MKSETILVPLLAATSIAIPSPEPFVGWQAFMNPNVLARDHGVLEQFKNRVLALKGAVLGQQGTDRFNHVKDQAVEQLNYAKEQAVKVDYGQLSSEILDWIQAHPYQTAFHVANGVVFFYPGLISKPILWGIGFGLSGPRAGKSVTFAKPHIEAATAILTFSPRSAASAASVYQAMIGKVPAKSLFAYLESAGAGGYGVGVVNTVTRAGAVVAEGVGNWKGMSGTDSKKPVDLVKM